MPTYSEPDDDEWGPYVCPGCFAVAERCHPGCPEARMEAEREDEYERGERFEDDDAEVGADDRPGGAGVPSRARRAVPGEP